MIDVFFGFSCDLIDLIDIDNPVLGTLNIVIGCLNDLQKNILNILSYISGLCESSASAMAKETFSSLASVCARSCL